MATALYLTSDEQKMFEALPEKLREGWEMKSESGGFQDSEQRRGIRAGLMRLKSEDMQSVKHALLVAQTEDAFLRAVDAIDFQSIPEGDLAELLFAVGPSGLTHVIDQMLTQASSDDDIFLIASLSVARHELMTSFSS
jgi:hypothetical protein